MASEEYALCLASSATAAGSVSACCTSFSVLFLSGGEAATAAPAGGDEREGMEWVIDGSVIAWSLVTLSLFNCVGFSDVGFPVVGFSDDGLSNDGGKETGCSWMMYSLLLNLPPSSVVWWRSMYPARSRSEERRVGKECGS